MATTFKVRMETLEKKLDEYETRLDLEEKRRLILEKWIHMNFDFDVSSELEITESQNNRRSPVKRENRNRIKRKTKIIKCDFDPLTAPSNTDAVGANPNKSQTLLVGEIISVEPTIVPEDHDVGGDSDNCIPASTGSEDSDSDSGVKRKPKVRKRQTQGNQNRDDGTFYIDPDFKMPGQLKHHFRYLKTFEPSPGSQELPQIEGQCLVPSCGRVLKIRGNRYSNWRRHVQDVHDVKLAPIPVTPKQGENVHRSKRKGTASRSGSQIPNPTDLLDSALKSIGVETTEPSHQNNSNATVNVTVTHFPSAQDSSGQSPNSSANEWS